jgi:hypothetical protein
MANKMINLLAKLSLTAATVLCSAGLSFAASCLPGSTAQNAAAVEEFKGSPASLLGGNRNPGDIVDQVRQLTASETDLTSGMLQLAAVDTTTPAQKAAIGAGLGRAANVCRATHPELADAIAQALAEALISNPALAGVQTAFVMALSGQTATAALGGASGSGQASGISSNSPAITTGGGEGGTGTDTSLNGRQNSDDNQLRLSRSGGGNFSTETIQQVSRTGV